MEKVRKSSRYNIYIYILVLLLCLSKIGSLESYAYGIDIFYYPNGGSWSWGSGRYTSYYSYSEDDSNNDDIDSWLPSETPRRDGYTFLGFTTNSTLGRIASTENFANALYNCRRGIPVTPYSETVWYQDFWGGWQSATASVDANGNIRTTGFSRGAKIDTVLRNLRYPGNMCNQTAYAIWEKAPGFTISFNVNGGSINISNQIALDITLPNPGTRPGYTFDGWYNGDKKIGGMGDKWKPTADTTITAKWNVITYHISYVLYEGTLNGSNPITYTVETPTITLVNPTQDKKRFTGWSDWNNSKPRNPYTIPKGTIGDLIISANWEVDTSNKPNVRDNVFHGSSNIVSNRFTIEVP